MTSRKKVGLIAGAGLGAAAAVALRRRWSGSEEPAEISSTPPPRGEPGEAGVRFLAHLSEAVRIPTVAYEETERVDFAAFARLRDFLARTYPLAHDRLDIETVAGHSLLFTWPGSDPAADPFLLMAHQDVVPVEEGTERGWELPPFAGERDEYHLYGRGSLDDKGSLIAILEAVEGLLEEGYSPVATVYLAFGHDEEAGGTGAEAVAALLSDRGVRLSFVLDEGGAVAIDFFPGVDVPVALVGIGEKGYVNVEVSARGQGGHSSAPPDHTAVGLVAAAVKAIEDHPMPARLDAQAGLLRVLGELVPGAKSMPLKRPDVFGALVERRLAASPTTNALIRTTGAATVMTGGVKPNVLPQQATAIVNFRVMPGDSVAAVLDHVRGVVGPGVTVAVAESSFSADPPRLADPDSAAFRLVAELAGEVLGVSSTAPWILTGATDSRHFVPLADQVLRFVPFTATADDFKRFHGTGERIRLADADAAVGFYRELISRAGTIA